MTSSAALYSLSDAELVKPMPISLRSNFLISETLVAYVWVRTLLSDLCRRSCVA
jgi:hypothetical protein